MSANAPQNYSRAEAHAKFNTIPDTITTVNVGLTSATTAGTATNSTLTTFAGKWIWLKARVGTITVVRGAATVVSGVGMVLAPGVAYPFYVSYDAAEHRLSHISDTASSFLDILSDSEAG